MSYKKDRSPSSINAGSMADIAFLLLIFFLVTTTIEADTGITRVLAPEIEVPPPPVPKRDVLEVLVNSNNEILVEGNPLSIDMLKEKTKQFIIGYQGDDAHPDYPRFEPTKSAEVKKYFGEIEVSKQVISLQNHRGTTYEAYIAVQNELAAAYNELRNELSMQEFSVSYDDLLKDERNAEKVKAIKSIYPMRISEANPY